MSTSEELRQLDELRQRGVLTEEEFTRAKARALNGDSGAPATDAINALRRSRSDRWLGGVCGGLGRVTGLPPWLWRLLFTLLVVLAGTGVLLYVLMWIFIPADPMPLMQTQRA